MFTDRTCCLQSRRSFEDHRPFQSCPQKTPAWFPCRTCPSLRLYVHSSNIRFGFGGLVRGTRCTWWVEFNIILTNPVLLRKIAATYVVRCTTYPAQLCNVCLRNYPVLIFHVERCSEFLKNFRILGAVGSWLAYIPLVSRSQKHLRSSSEGVNIWSKLIKCTAAEFTYVPDLFPLSIQPNVMLSLSNNTRSSSHITSAKESHARDLKLSSCNSSRWCKVKLFLFSGVVSSFVYSILAKYLSPGSSEAKYAQAVFIASMLSRSDLKQLRVFGEDVSVNH